MNFFKSWSLSCCSHTKVLRDDFDRGGKNYKTEEIATYVVSQSDQLNVIVSNVYFGDCVSANEINAIVSGPKLFKDMFRIFSKLRQKKINYSLVRYF